MSLRLIVLGTRSSSTSVELRRDGVGDVRQLLLLLLEVLCVGGGGVLFKPVGCFLDCVKDLFLISFCSLSNALQDSEEEM
jgi:hypothetical protein